MDTPLRSSRTHVIEATCPDAVREQYRTALSHFGSGVVIVTSTDDDGSPIGMTVGSFSSISMEPPLVGFFAAHTSTTLPGILGRGTFCVNVLAESQHALARSFARTGADKFAGVEWTPDAAGSPRLADAHAWIGCTLDVRTSIGDHDLVVGAVDTLVIPTESDPLLFHRSMFHGLRPTR
ncbi:flavin reductase family protein [Gordonia hydrophobica]|uniref:Flavin reductase family protein n=1 Tax=Gordonia hydrophobica TaxID=40516 RepID=A0ABZ2U500_9ACTN|nr:flavin reductase family protein [Gordonia hydrophobica]MBM7369011.1 flavin reductase (DIM6/NTAB) family NADH-FMN oxidoreductase RutF [Gordonia hydrophobica]